MSQGDDHPLRTKVSEKSFEGGIGRVRYILAMSFMRPVHRHVHPQPKTPNMRPNAIRPLKLVAATPHKTNTMMQDENIEANAKNHESVLSER